MNPADVVELFIDGEPVAPDALMAALATTEGREHLRGLLELRALMADAPDASGAAASGSPRRSGWTVATRLAAAAALVSVAAAGGYAAGRSQSKTLAKSATIDAIAPPPAPTTVIKLDAATGWRDQSGGF